MMPAQPSTSSGTALNVTRGIPRWRTNDKDGKRSGSNWRSKSRGKSQDKKTMVCWKCGKSGHMKKDYRGSGKAVDPPLVSVAREEDEDNLLDDDIAL